MAQPDRTAAARQRLLSGQAWDDFCDTLKVAGRHIHAVNGPLSDLDRAEWYRFMTRLARSSMERLLENAVGAQATASAGRRCSMAKLCETVSRSSRRSQIKSTAPLVSKNSAR